jgi:hypothetical protein
MSIRLRWPTEYGTVTQRFLDRPGYYSQFSYWGVDGERHQLPGHEGIDLEAPLATRIFACADGVVSSVRLDGNANPMTMPYGNQVRIRHEDGYETIYAHLKEVHVHREDTVSAGDLIGRAGDTGNASASHLHLTLKKQGATLAGETIFMNDIIDPTPFLEPFSEESIVRRWQPDHPLRGLHGDVAADWMLNSGVKGWAVETVYSMGNLDNPRPVDFSAHAEAGVRVIARWSFSWARSEGGLGTFPVRARYTDFIRWCVRSIRASRGVWGHVIGNEPNRAGERPDYVNADNPGTPILPSDVTFIYNAVWNQLSVETRGSPPAIDPTNIETMDPLEYWRAMLPDLAGAEFFALHAYSYGSDQPVDSSDRFRHMPWQYHSFRMWEPLAQVLYDSPYTRTPIIITETNHLFRTDNRIGWDPGADQWVRQVYDYIHRWNQGFGDQYVHGVCLYRFEGDDWMISNKPRLLTAMRDSGAQPI